MRLSSSVGSFFLFGLGLVLAGCTTGEGDHVAGDGYATATDDEALTKVCGAKTNGPVQGYDVSYYQGAFAWKGKGVQFGAARISDGTGFIDPDFDGNWSRMKAAGVIRGAYQFFEPGQDEVAQANLVIKKVGKLGPGELPVQFDIEVTGGQSPATIRKKAQHWLDLVEKGTGKRPFVYSYGSFLETNLGSGFGKYPLWIANYGPSCPSVPSGWKNWVIWQYSDGSGKLDHDVFNGTETELKEFAGDLPPRGYLDTASCTTISGWAQDQIASTKAINVDVYVDAPVGKKGTGEFALTANIVRNDIKKVAGSTNHGFSSTTPLSLLDTEPHKIYAYGMAATAGLPNTLLTNAPKAMTCAYAKMPVSTTDGVIRHVPSTAVLTAWKLSTFWSKSPQTAATVDAYTKGDDFPDAPEVVKADDGSAAVYVIDGDVKRHVVSTTSLKAWNFTVKTMEAAKLAAIPAGPDWRVSPFMVQAKGEAAVYMLDLAPPTPPGTEPTGEGSDPQTDDGSDDSSNDNGDSTADDQTPVPNDNADSSSGSSGGCSVSSNVGSSNGAAGLGLLVAGLGLVAVRRRRSTKG
ncbi:MAG TPA: GH25 family lysozyme [Polyangiaceae bacterium]